MSNLVINVTVNERDEDGVHVDMHTEVHDLTSREVAYCLAEAVNDVLSENASQCGLSLSFLRMKFLEILMS